MIILDTDVISYLMRPHPPHKLVAHLADVELPQQATTAVTVGELSYGAHRVNRPELYERAARLLANVRVLPFDQEAAEEYGRLRSILERQGTPLADPDLRIAAMAIVHDAALVTGNIRHFERVRGLSVANWLDR